MSSPYILSPFSMGQGSRWIDDDGAPGAVRFVNSYWNDARSHSLASPASSDDFTGGLVGNIALPLLADFWTYCDSAELPAGNGYIALGTNGWQVSLTVQSGAQPNFRVLSAGRAALNTAQAPICRGPGDPQWNNASGGYTPTGGGTPGLDNSVYWMMTDYLKRTSVVTAGFSVVVPAPSAFSVLSATSSLGSSGSSETCSSRSSVISEGRAFGSTSSSIRIV